MALLSLLLWATWKSDTCYKTIPLSSNPCPRQEKSLQQPYCKGKQWVFNGRDLRFRKSFLPFLLVPWLSKSLQQIHCKIPGKSLNPLLSISSAIGRVELNSLWEFFLEESLAQSIAIESSHRSVARSTTGHKQGKSGNSSKNGPLSSSPRSYLLFYQEGRLHYYFTGTDKDTEVLRGQELANVLLVRIRPSFLAPMLLPLCLALDITLGLRSHPMSTPGT